MTRFVYVLPATGRRWSVLLVHGGQRIKIPYRRKAHALIAARAIALVIGGEVQPHDRRGRIQDPDSYGNDPRESRG